MYDPMERHHDPLREAASQSAQFVTQMISLTAAAAEVVARRRALQAAREANAAETEQRALREQEAAARAQARAQWAPALDDRWLASADLLATGRAWGAAAPFADTDPEAATVLRRTEQRLWDLHPYAMAQYTRLREAGASPLDAMRGSVHHFRREPNARRSYRTTWPVVEQGVPGTAPDPATSPSPAAGAPGQADSAGQHQEAVRRGLGIAMRLRAGALADGADLTADELVTALETRTTLSAHVIAQVVQADAEQRLADVAERARAADLGRAASAPPAANRSGDRTAARSDTITADTQGAFAAADRSEAARLAAESFPRTVSEGIQAATSGGLQSAQPASPSAGVQNTRRVNVPS